MYHVEYVSKNSGQWVRLDGSFDYEVAHNLRDNLMKMGYEVVNVVHVCCGNVICECNDEILDDNYDEDNYSYSVICDGCGFEIDCDFNMYPMNDGRALCHTCYHSEGGED